jgi:ribosomal protein S17E
MEGMEKQLTAIDWLLENLITEPFSEADFEHNSNCWDKAKEMEKQQIMETYYQALCDRFEHNLIPISFTRKEEVERFGIPYYNETFKSE